jgi:hypothetical protein
MVLPTHHTASVLSMLRYTSQTCPLLQNQQLVLRCAVCSG